MSAKDKTTPAPDQGVNAHITSAGRRLAKAFADLVDALPGQPQRPQDVARTLGVDKNLAHRLMTALRQKDPLATAYYIPGPQPLRRVVKASIAKGLPPKLSEPAEEAIHVFDELIRREAGDRLGLDAIISSGLPEARPTYENEGKQLMYRGARQIRGITCEVLFRTCFIHPSRDSRMFDSVLVQGYLGLRRVRPTAKFKLGVQNAAIPGDMQPALNLDGEPIKGPQSVILEQFCSGPRIELDVYRFDTSGDVVYGLKWGNAVGVNSTRDVVLATLRRTIMRRYRQPNDPRPKHGFVDGVNVPSRTFICDLVLHEDVYPEWEPRVRIFETGELGRANPNDPTRELDVLDLAERVEPLGWDINRFRAPEIQSYIELLNFVCAKLGWDPTRFRGYRTRIDYPMFGSQVQYSIDLPLDPSASESDA